MPSTASLLTAARLRAAAETARAAAAAVASEQQQQQRHSSSQTARGTSPPPSGAAAGVGGSAEAGFAFPTSPQLNADSDVIAAAGAGGARPPFGIISASGTSTPARAPPATTAAAAHGSAAGAQPAFLHLDVSPSATTGGAASAGTATADSRSSSALRTASQLIVASQLRSASVASATSAPPSLSSSVSASKDTTASPRHDKSGDGTRPGSPSGHWLASPLGASPGDEVLMQGTPPGAAAASGSASGAAASLGGTTTAPSESGGDGASLTAAYHSAEAYLSRAAASLPSSPLRSPAAAAAATTQGGALSDLNPMDGGLSPFGLQGAAGGAAMPAAGLLRYGSGLDLAAQMDGAATASGSGGGALPAVTATSSRDSASPLSEARRASRAIEEHMDALYQSMAASQAGLGLRAHPLVHDVPTHNALVAAELALLSQRNSVLAAEAEPGSKVQQQLRRSVEVAVAALRQLTGSQWQAEDFDSVAGGDGGLLSNARLSLTIKPAAASPVPGGGDRSSPPAASLTTPGSPLPAATPAGLSRLDSLKAADELMTKAAASVARGGLQLPPPPPKQPSLAAAAAPSSAPSGAVASAAAAAALGWQQDRAQLEQQLLTWQQLSWEYCSAWRAATEELNRARAQLAALSSGGGGGAAAGAGAVAPAAPQLPAAAVANKAAASHLVVPRPLEPVAIKSSLSSVGAAISSAHPALLSRPPTPTGGAAPFTHHCCATSTAAPVRPSGGGAFVSSGSGSISFASKAADTPAPPDTPKTTAVAAVAAADVALSQAYGAYYKAERAVSAVPPAQRLRQPGAATVR